MKAVLMSIQPLWCEYVALLKKFFEVRKTKPNLEVPFKVYIYCTKNTKKNARHLYINTGYGRKNFGVTEWWRSGKDVVDVNSHLPAYRFDALLAEGKVIGEFICDKIISFGYDEHICYPTPAYEGDDSIHDCGEGYWITGEELEQTCLTYEELCAYGKGKDLYGLHISNVVIYDKPKDLSEFRSYNCSVCIDDNGYPMPTHSITRAPQSWCYVEV